jgi:hypothetical protein
MMTLTNNHIVNYILSRKHDLPLTREVLLDYMYMGDVPDEIGPEDEAEIASAMRLLKSFGAGDAETC